MESDFESAKENVRAHLTRSQSCLDSKHYSHIHVAKKWLTNAERPRYGLNDKRFDPLSRNDCDVYMVSAGRNREGQRRLLDLLANEEDCFILDRPVHIRGEGSMWNVTAEDLAFWLAKSSSKVESQSYGAQNEDVDARELLDIIRRENTPAGSHGKDRALRAPLNVLNPETDEPLEQPRFLTARYGVSRRFGLLNDLGSLARRIAPPVVRYKTPKSQVPSGKLARDQEFQLLATTLAFSGTSVDILGGTWIRVLDGEGLCLFASEKTTRLNDLASFKEEAEKRVPEKAILVTLEKGDILYMPAETRFIHASLTLRPCYVQGGIVWDYRSILQTLRIRAWTCKKSANVTNEDVPPQLSNVITALKLVAGLDGCKTYADACGMELTEFQTDFKKALAELSCLTCFQRRGKSRHRLSERSKKRSVSRSERHASTSATARERSASEALGKREPKSDIPLNNVEEASCCAVDGMEVLGRNLREGRGRGAEVAEEVGAALSQLASSWE